jgi:hypothetical protein
MPDAGSRRACGAHSSPTALLFCYPKQGHALERDFKWLGSHRYGILHLGGRDAARPAPAREERASACWAGPPPTPTSLGHAPRRPLPPQFRRFTPPSPEPPHEHHFRSSAGATWPAAAAAPWLLARLRRHAGAEPFQPLKPVNAVPAKATTIM